MFQPVETSKKVIDCGDILYGDIWISQVFALNTPEMIKDYRLPIFSTSPWETLKNRLINSDLLENTFKYSCPFKRNGYYYWYIPACILLRDKDPYKYFKNKEDPSIKFNTDIEYWKTYLKEGPAKPNSIQQSFLGHGFTFSTLPSDGIVELKLATIELDNGDALLGWVWVWFNK